MDKKSTLQKKLQSYSVLAGATLAGVTANGQVIYTDIEDVIIDEPGEFYDIDLNQDGSADFRLEYMDGALATYNYGGMEYSSWLKGPLISGFGKGNAVLGKGWSFGIGLTHEFEDSTIISNKSFSSYNRGVLRALYGKAVNGEVYFSQPFGDFDSVVVDKYIGLRFMFDGQLHLGWLRVDVTPNEDDTQFAVRLKDFAYNQIPYSAIVTGVGSDIDTLPAPTNIVAKDSTDLYTAQDCFVSWKASTADTLVTEYGVVVVKSEKADNVTLQDLIDTEGGHAVRVTPDNSASYQVNLRSGMVDLDGDPVQLGRAYKIMVYVYDETGYHQASWAFSNEITLSSSNELATEIISKDIANNGDASDLQVSFTKAGDESNIEEYRIMIVRSSNIDSFDSLTAAFVSIGNYTVVTPDGSNHEVVLDAAMNDYQGNPINQATEYYAYVVSVLKSGAGFRIGTPSNLVVLNIPAPEITGVKVKDVSDFGTGYDIELQFKTPLYDSTFNSIRFVIIPTEQLGKWTDEQLLNANVSRTYDKSNIDILGSVDTLRLYPYTYDVNGKYLSEGISYTIYPIVQSGTHTTGNTLCPPVEITLTSPIGSLEEVFAVNVATDFKPSDWKIVMQQAEKESHISEYRIMAVKAENASSFDLNAAKAVTAGNFVSVAPSGNPISKIMPADLLDVDGMGIENETKYQFFVLAVGNSKSSGDTLSQASNSVSLIKVSNIEEQVADAGKIYYHQGTIHVLTPERTREAKIVITSINGSVVLNDNLQVGQEMVQADNLPVGIYVVNIISEEINIAKKLLIK